MGRHSQAALRGILGKNKDQLSQIVSEKFQLDIITGKNCFLLQGISINLIYLPIHCRFWDQERLKKLTTVWKNPTFLHTLLPPSSLLSALTPAPLLRQWPVQETGTSARGASSFTGSSFSRLHLAAPALAKPWTQPLPRYPHLSSLLLLHCGLLSSFSSHPGLVSPSA